MVSTSSCVGPCHCTLSEFVAGSFGGGSGFFDVTNSKCNLHLRLTGKKYTECNWRNSERSLKESGHLHRTSEETKSCMFVTSLMILKKCVPTSVTNPGVAVNGTGRLM